jgi:hypothetical protein
MQYSVAIICNIINTSIIIQKNFYDFCVTIFSSFIFKNLNLKVFTTFFYLPPIKAVYPNDDSQLTIAPLSIKYSVVFKWPFLAAILE